VQFGNDQLGALSEAGLLKELTVFLSSWELVIGTDVSSAANLVPALGAFLSNLAVHQQGLCARLRDPWKWGVSGLFPDFMAYGTWRSLLLKEYPPQHTNIAYKKHPAGVQFCLGFKNGERYDHIDLLYPHDPALRLTNISEPIKTPFVEERGRLQQDSAEVVQRRKAPDRAESTPLNLSHEAFAPLREVAPLAGVELEAALRAAGTNIHEIIAAYRKTLGSFHEGLAKGLEEHLQKLEGVSFGSLEANQKFAAEVSQILRATGFRCVCSTCGEPALLRVSRGTSPEGVFQFEHGSLRHGGKAALPRVRLVLAPLDRQPK